MNVASVSTSAGWPTVRATGTDTSASVTAKGTAGSAGTVSGAAEKDFLRYAKMSPMERMRASILKGMNLTEEQLAALPREERQKVEDQIKDTIKKMVGDNGEKGRLVDLSA